MATSLRSSRAMLGRSPGESRSTNDNRHAVLHGSLRRGEEIARAVDVDQALRGLRVSRGSGGDQIMVMVIFTIFRLRVQRCWQKQ